MGLFSPFHWNYQLSRRLLVSRSARLQWNESRPTERGKWDHALIPLRELPSSPIRRANWTLTKLCGNILLKSACLDDCKIQSWVLLSDTHWGRMESYLHVLSIFSSLALYFAIHLKIGKWSSPTAKKDSCNNYRRLGITWYERGGQRASKRHHFDIRRHIPGTFLSFFVCSSRNFVNKLLTTAPDACFRPFWRYMGLEGGKR